MAVIVLLVAGLGPPRESLAVGNPSPTSAPGFDWRAWSPPSSIELGESFNLRFRLDDLTDSAEDGSISVSFPDLTQSGSSSTSYSSSQGSVRTDRYTSGSSKVKYYDRGDSIWNSSNSQMSARYLLVEPLDPNWPTNASRTLELEVTPKEAGVFRVLYRFWLCVDNYSDCSREPRGRDVDDRDQQGFDVAEFRIRVEEPEEEAPEFDWRAWSPPSSVAVGESFRLKFRLDDLSDEADDGSISVSFPNLTLSGGDSTHYSSSQGSVQTVSYTSGTSKVKYYDRGDSTWNSRKSQESADYLLVEPLDMNWPTNASRTLELEVTPKEAGVFRVLYRFWLCVDDYSDCSREPTGRNVDDRDQQGFDVAEFGIQVVQSNSPPTVTAVSPLQSQTVDVGDSVTFRARATDDDGNISQVDWYVNGSWVSGQSLAETESIERSYRHTFSSGGGYRVEAVFTDTDGASDSVYWDLHAGQSPTVNSLGCSASRVDVGETVSCTPSIGGGNPTRYLWGSIGGNPWSGTSRAFSTQWDTAGQKTIVFEACNNDGCSNGEHWVDVVQGADPPPIIHSLDCSSSNVMTAENVACSARLGGGSPSRYQWSTRGGSPSSGNSSSFSTHWDSPGNKQITLEVCNDGGCDTNQFAVVVEREVPATLRVTTSGQILAGSSITLAGSGFPVFRGVDDVSVGGRTVPLQFGPSTDGNGEFTVRIAVPSLSPGTYDVVAEVYGKAARTSVEINQLPQPQLPPRVSRVSPTSSLSIAVGTIQQFTAQARDPNDDITRVEWLVNGQMERSEPIGSTGDVGKSWSYRVRSTGNYRVSARFTDGIGQSGSVEWQVEAVAQTPPPRVDDPGCGPLTVAIEETVTCNPRLSRGDAFSYSWRADGGVPWSGGQETFSTAWRTAGQKEIELEVCNPQNVCDTSTQIVTVEDAWAEPPKIVTLGCSPPFVEVGEFVSCYPEIRTDGPVEYSWRAAGGLPSSGDGRSFRTRWPSEGAWEMTLRVCSDGGCSNASSAGGVSETPGGNRPPVAARVSPSSPVTLRAGQAQTFTARAIDAEGNLHAAGWLVSQWYTPANVGFSSTSSSTQQFTHVFNAPGNYRVSVIYYDRRWEASIVGWDVTVVENPEVGSSDDIIVIPLPELDSFKESLATLNELKKNWLACVQNHPGDERQCSEELVGGATASPAIANMSSIFDRYREQGFADEYIRGIEFALVLAGLPRIETSKAALLILEGAICGQLCFDLDVPGSDDPWYLVGWLIAGAVPIADIATDGRDFLWSSGTCVTRLLTMNECDWVSYGANLGGLVFSIVPIAGQVANVAQAGVHIAKFAVKAPKKTGTVLRHAKKIPFVEDTLDAGVVWAANKFMKNSVSRTEFIGTFMGEKTGKFSEVTIKRNLDTHVKIADAHSRVGTQSRGKSLFDDDANIGQLIDEANLVHPRYQEAGSGNLAGLQWIVDAGDRIGLGRVDGQYFPTSIYTVITDFDGVVRTAHPGIPDLPVKVGSIYNPN